MTEEFQDERLDAVLHRLGERVRAMRLARGMSITSLSFEAELSEERLRALEAGRAAVPLPVLVALADVFEVGVADLFGDGTAPLPPSDAIDAPSSSPHVVPSPVIWGGELPPAPWLTSVPAAADADVADPIVRSRPEPVPAAPRAYPEVPVSPAGAAYPQAPAVPGAAASADAATPAPAPRVSPRSAAAARGGGQPSAPSAVPRVFQRAAERGMRGASPYVFVAPGAGAAAVAPRTFADLRTGPLADRNFRSLQEFAIASVVEGRHSLADVARVFRVPVWRLEQWVREAGHTV